MEHQIDVHRLINRRRIVHVQLHREVLIRIDRDGDRELVHRYILSATTSSSVNAVRSRSHDWIHFRNGDQRQEDDVLVNDPELKIRTTANDFSIAGNVRQVLVGTQHTNRTTNHLEHLGWNDVRVFDVRITEGFHLRCSCPYTCSHGRQQSC